ncbi:hypothetical protein EVAR_32814_1 [Eumeta japonica]|uniref:Uncharacterized protein n=1 Tax=Eumeta variegata TaxID=151549 RepID=A0A4C1WD12_EUMVA|nr:hypothetical protein EVAR_32814_1 [Eumeta japonica]
MKNRAGVAIESETAIESRERQILKLRTNLDSVRGNKGEYSDTEENRTKVTEITIKVYCNEIETGLR